MLGKIKLKQIDIADIKSDLQMIKDCVKRIDDKEINNNVFLCDSVLLFVKDIENVLDGKKERIKLR